MWECETCRGNRVQIKLWVDVNAPAETDFDVSLGGIEEYEYGYCLDCEDNRYIQDVRPDSEANEEVTP